MHPSFNEYGLAAFTILSFGRVYINRTGRIIIRDVAFFDNGPDDFHHGLVRIERDGKWGYADPTGRIVVPMQYSCALNYKDQYTDIGPILCVGCHSQKVGEYTDCDGGKWFRTDPHGTLTPTSPPK
jgi:WG containing repeat